MQALGGFVPHRHVSINQRCANVLHKHGAQICTSMTRQVSGTESPVTRAGTIAELLQ